MQQTIKNSQTPSFEKNKSCTTAILFQSPTAQEQRPSFWSKVKANTKEFALFSGISLIAWPPVTYAVMKVFGG